MGSRATAAKPTHVAWREPERRRTPAGDFDRLRPSMCLAVGRSINLELIRLAVSGIIVPPKLVRSICAINEIDGAGRGESSQISSNSVGMTDSHLNKSNVTSSQSNLPARNENAASRNKQILGFLPPLFTCPTDYSMESGGRIESPGERALASRSGRRRGRSRRGGGRRGGCCW